MRSDEIHHVFFTVANAGFVAVEADLLDKAPIRNFDDLGLDF